MSKICDLPIEIYGEIVQYVDDIRDLHGLLFVSRIFHYEAERRLYGSFEVTLSHKDRHTESLRSLSNNPSIATQLRCLDLFGVRDSDGPACTPPDDPWIYLLPQAFRSLNNLKDLRLPLKHSSGFVPPSSVTFRLEVFRCTTYFESRPLESMVPFLTVQDTIQTLIEDGATDNVKEGLPARCLPNLMRLCAWPAVAQMLLPNRSIKYLFLQQDIDQAWEAGIAQSVEYLAAISIAFIRNSAASFPALKYLEIGEAVSTEPDLTPHH